MGHDLFSSNKGELAASKLAEDLAEQELYTEAADEVAPVKSDMGFGLKPGSVWRWGKATEAAYLKLRVEMTRLRSMQ